MTMETKEHLLFTKAIEAIEPITPQNLRWVENATFRDITPRTMTLLDKHYDQQVIDNRFINHKLLINKYVCDECRYPTKTVKLHVGAAPTKIFCVQEDCTGIARSGNYMPKQHFDEYDGHLDLEWFRPVLPSQIDAFKAQIEAVRRYATQGGEEIDPARWEDLKSDLPIWDESGEWEIQARLLLSGVLLKAPFGSTEWPMDEHPLAKIAAD